MNTTPSSSHLERIADLTRRYARYSRHYAGLGAVWAGACLSLLGGLVLANDVTRYLHRPAADAGKGFWRFLISQPPVPQDSWVVILALALPIVWLLGRVLLQRRVYERAGTVVGRESAQDLNSRQIVAIIELAAPVIVIGGESLLLTVRHFLGRFSTNMLPGALLAAVVALAIPLVGRRLSSSLDRTASLLLLFGTLTVAGGGVAESLLVSTFLYAVLGLALAGFGLHSHHEFRRVRRELDQLSAEPVATTVSAPAAN